jgi:hypothetical protein
VGLSGSLCLNRLDHYPSDRRTHLYLIGTASGDWSNDFSAQTLPDAALDVIPSATRISTAFPESPRPDFKRHLDSFVAAVVEHLE